MSNISRACIGRAQSARIARCRARADTLAPLALAHTAAPRHALPASQHRAKPPCHATAPPPRHSWRHSGVRSGSSHGQRRPNPSRSPPGPWSSASSSTRVSASVRRRHVALATERRFAGELIPTAAEPTLARYKWTPRASPSTQATLCYPHGAPLPRIRPGKASFLISGNSCRRHRPGQSGTSSISPSPFSSPGTSSSFREHIPLLDFDREPP